MGIQELYRDYTLNYISNSGIWGYKGYTGIVWGGCQNHGPFLDPSYNTAPNS